MIMCPSGKWGSMLMLEYSSINVLYTVSLTFHLDGTLEGLRVNLKSYRMTRMMRTCFFLRLTARNITYIKENNKITYKIHKISYSNLIKIKQNKRTSVVQSTV